MQMPTTQDFLHQTLQDPMNSAQALGFEQLGQNQIQIQPDKIDRTSWIDWYCSLSGHEFLLAVDRDFLDDKMNLICLENAALGLKMERKNLNESLRTILRGDKPSDNDLQNEEFLARN